MTHTAWCREGRPIDAEAIRIFDWEKLKQTTLLLGDFIMRCCKTPAVLKTSINGRLFFPTSRMNAPLRQRPYGIAMVRQPC
jgi:hypothetical protein